MLPTVLPVHEDLREDHGRNVHHRIGCRGLRPLSGGSNSDDDDGATDPGKGGHGPARPTRIGCQNLCSC